MGWRIKKRNFRLFVILFLGVTALILFKPEVTVKNHPQYDKILTINEEILIINNTIGNLDWYRRQYYQDEIKMYDSLKQVFNSQYASMIEPIKNETLEMSRLQFDVFNERLTTFDSEFQAWKNRVYAKQNQRPDR